MSQTKKNTQSRQHLFRHYCASGNVVELLIDEERPREFGEYDRIWRYDPSPQDVTEYECCVVGTLSRIAGYKIKLTDDPPISGAHAGDNMKGEHAR